MPVSGNFVGDCSFTVDSPFATIPATLTAEQGDQSTSAMLGVASGT